VIDAHGGEIGVNCEPTTIMRSQAWPITSSFPSKCRCGRNATNSTLTPVRSPSQEREESEETYAYETAQALTLRRRL